MAWQQQQAMQQKAWQQQQAYILEQQQQQYRQAQSMPQNMPRNNPQAAPQAMPQNTQSAQQSVEQWQDQLTARQTAAGAPDHRSRIFTARNPEPEAKQSRSWKSKIFGQKKEEYDGLVGGETEAADDAAGCGKCSILG
jgi:hypothetical protein